MLVAPDYSEDGVYPEMLPPPQPVLPNTANVYETKTSAHDRQNEEVSKGILYFKMQLKHL